MLRLLSCDNNYFFVGSVPEDISRHLNVAAETAPATVERNARIKNIIGKNVRLI